MLRILLGILGILGIAVLAVLLLVLSLLTLVLFYPLSYQFYAGIDPDKRVTDKEESEDNKTKVSDTTVIRAGIRWLFGLINISYDYPNPGKPIIKVAGRNLILQQKPKATGNRDGGLMQADGLKQEYIKPEEGKKEENIKAESKKAESKKEESIPGESSPETVKEDKWQLLQSIPEKIAAKLQGIWNKIKELTGQAQYFIGIIREEDTRQFVSQVIKRLLKICRRIKPRRIFGELLIGTGSPDTTGYVMAAYGMIYPYLGQNLSITADFDRKILRGEVNAKGRILLVFLVYHGLMILLDRRLHALIRKLKKGGPINVR